MAGAAATDVVASEVGAAAAPAADDIASAGIRFGQRAISATFRNGEFAGRTVASVAEGLQSGAVSPNQLPINVVVRDGVSYTMNNRSLMALRLAGVAPTIINNVTGNAVFERALTQRLAQMAGQVAAEFVPNMR